MSNAKIENLLNLALEANETERQKSLNLSVGYQVIENTWEVIIRYVGNAIEQIEELLNSRGVERQITVLDNNYAILVLPEELIDEVASLNRVIYMEKPKSFFFELNFAKRASCISAVQTSVGNTDSKELNLSGKGCLVAVIDSGIDYAHPDFQNEDGSTRIMALWDQTLDVKMLNANSIQNDEGITYTSPKGYDRGVIFDEGLINRALQETTDTNRQRIVPSRDSSGHGTHVAGIAAGNGRASMGRYRGVAYEADLLVVKLGKPLENSFPSTTELMMAVDYCIKKAEELERPLAINLSFGNNYGSHSGSGLLETFLNDMAQLHQCSIVTGTGNEGGGTRHYQNRINSNSIQEIELTVSSFETRLNLQIWKRYQDEIGIEIILPDGSTTGELLGQGALRMDFSQVQLLVFYGEPSPYSMYQEIYIDFIPKETYIPEGLWKIHLKSGRILDGTYEMWLPSGGVLNDNTGFPYPSEIRTLTIPSTAERLISVAAYDANTDSVAGFSGRGYTAWTDQYKPDLAAPGVNIVAPSPGNSYVARSGTSMASPFVTGSAALMMEWGIINRRDVFLYGEKLKAYLIKGAKKLPAFEEYPNPQIGWGALCLRDSIPERKV